MKILKIALSTLLGFGLFGMIICVIGIGAIGQSLIAQSYILSLTKYVYLGGLISVTFTTIGGLGWVLLVTFSALYQKEL